MSPRINTSLSAGEIDQFRLLLEAAERSDGRPSVGAVDHLLEALRREHGPDGRPDLFMKRERPVILSTEIDGDLGIVPPKAARRLARIEADSLGVTVFIRDATTDLVVEVVTPSKRRR